MNRFQPCRCCNGSGRQVNQQALGLDMKKKRLRKRISLREVARLTGWSVSYLSELENGQRRWNELVIESYNQALKNAQ